MVKLNQKKVVKKKTTKPKTTKKTKTLALVKAQPRKRIKNPLEYYECMKTCCLKGQKIAQTAQECKHNALTINAQMSVQKVQAAKKIRAGYKQMGIGLSEFIKASK